MNKIGEPVKQISYFESRGRCCISVRTNVEPGRIGRGVSTQFEKEQPRPAAL